MPFPGTVRRVVLVKTNASEERTASIIRVTRIGELGTTLAATNNRNAQCVRLLVTADLVPSSLIPFNLRMEAIPSSEMSGLTKDKLRNIPEVGIVHSHCRENLKSYITLTGWTL
jgi:hypothetical protein